MLAGGLPGITEAGPELLPLDAGEQYRFTFEMSSCIGCHSCEVACAEQNGNPAGVNWRRVGEVEGGEFPHTRRFHLSMSCNHCLEPACLIGCPTLAYVKLPNGVVQHRAEECIGCQYCTWNCPYGAPVYNPERRVVTKCDLCLPRLESGGLPACVEACPTHAIGVEKVDVAAWRGDHWGAEGPNLPPAGLTISTTRIVLPDDMPTETMGGGDHRLAPGDPHWPLVVMTLLTQAAVGAVAATLMAGGGAAGAVVAFLAAVLALGASVFHLGRPVHAAKALRNLRRSWLSREVAYFSAFAAAAFGYAAISLASPSATGPRSALGAGAVALGLAGVHASARIYMVPARPVWNSHRTPAAFALTAVSLGPLLALLAGLGELEPGATRALLAAAASGVVGQLLVQLSLLAGLAGRSDREHRASTRLLLDHFGGLFALRLGLALAALGILGWAAATGSVAAPAGWGLVLLGTGELIGRYLFYVTVVPTDMPGSFWGRR